MVKNTDSVAALVTSFLAEGGTSFIRSHIGEVLTQSALPLSLESQGDQLGEPLGPPHNRATHHTPRCGYPPVAQGPRHVVQVGGQTLQKRPMSCVPS